MLADSFPSLCGETLGERWRMVNPDIRRCQPLILPDRWKPVKGRPGQPSSLRTITRGCPPAVDVVGATVWNPAD